MRTLLSVVVLLAAACKEKPASSDAVQRADTDVKPAFEGAPRQVTSKVAALCEALHQMPAERRAACCRGQTAAHLAGECARIVSLALEQGTVELQHSDACVKDLVLAHQGCAWVGPNEPTLPESCSGVVAGKLAEGKRCRSALECVSGLRCLGAGPTAAGRCAPPGQDGAACELPVDVLAAHLRQTLPPHLECAGFCQRHQCEAALTDGGSCTVDAQCPQGQRCAGTCVPGARGGAGERCVPGGCVAPLRCVAGTCATPKPEGDECAADVECLGACRDADGGKRCGPGCS